MVDTEAEETMALLSKKDGHYGGTYDSHITIDITVEPGTVPNIKPSISLCTVHNLISTNLIRIN